MLAGLSLNRFQLFDLKKSQRALPTCAAVAEPEVFPKITTHTGVEINLMFYFHSGDVTAANLSPFLGIGEQQILHNFQD